MKLAVFDIGTNSIHMKIVQINSDFSFETLEHEKDMTCVGAGSFESRELSKTAIRRALKVIERFHKEAKRIGADKTIAVATSAVRDARNGDALVEAVYKKTGMKVRIITGEEEARFIFLGVSSDSEFKKGKVLVADVGGGSLELVSGGRKKIDYIRSFDLGAARLSERFITGYPVPNKEIRRLEAFIVETLNGTARRLRKKGYSRILGTAGTFINLASIVYEAKESRPLRLRNAFELKRKDLKPIYQKLIRMNEKQLKRMPGLDRKRSNIIVAGCVLVMTLMRLLKADKVFVSDKGIREGLLLDFILKNKIRRKVGRPSLDVRWFGQKPFFSGKINA